MCLQALAVPGACVAKHKVSEITDTSSLSKITAQSLSTITDTSREAPEGELPPRPSGDGAQQHVGFKASFLKERWWHSPWGTSPLGQWVWGHRLWSRSSSVPRAGSQGGCAGTSPCAHPRPLQVPTLGARSAGGRRDPQPPGNCWHCWHRGFFCHGAGVVQVWGLGNPRVNLKTDPKAAACRPWSPSSRFWVRCTSLTPRTTPPGLRARCWPLTAQIPEAPRVGSHAFYLVPTPGFAAADPGQWHGAAVPCKSPQRLGSALPSPALFTPPRGMCPAPLLLLRSPLLFLLENCPPAQPLEGFHRRDLPRAAGGQRATGCPPHPLPWRLIPQVLLITASNELL